jgi:hypothetical protein
MLGIHSGLLMNPIFGTDNWDFGKSNSLGDMFDDFLKGDMGYFDGDEDDFFPQRGPKVSGGTDAEKNERR